MGAAVSVLLALIARIDFLSIKLFFNDDLCIFKSSKNLGRFKGLKTFEREILTAHTQFVYNEIFY